MQQLTDRDRAELGRIMETAFDLWWARKMGISPTERDMVERHGEAVSQTAAASILGVSLATIGAMLKDGRLTGGSHWVAVRSIAKYLDNGRPSAQRHKKAQEVQRRQAAGEVVFVR